MTVEALESLVNRWIEAFNQRDWDSYGACFAPDVSYLTPGRSEPLRGRDAHVAQDQRNAGAARLVARLIIVASDEQHVVIEGAFEAPDRVSQWVTVLEIREGLIAAERLYFDRLRPN